MALSSPAELVSPLPVVAVVAPQFCMPYVVALKVTRKARSLTDCDLFISDVNGTVLMKFEDCVLYNTTGSPIISMSGQRLSMHRRWNVYRGDSSDQKDLLFTVKKSHMLQLKTELNVFLAANTAEQHCDFKVKGSWNEESYTFYLGDTTTIVALMSHQCELKNFLRGNDTFGVTVYPNVDYAFVVAIILILDEINRDRMVKLRENMENIIV